MKVISRSLTFTALFALAAITTHAQTPIVDFTGGITGFPTADAVVGYEFRISNSILIDALGVWDEGANGLSNNHTVGLWNFNGSNLIASTTVTNAAIPVTSTSANGRWLAAPIGNLVLTPGTYILGATFFNRDMDLLRYLTTATSVTNVTYGTSRQIASTPLVFPTTISTSLDAGIFGPNAFRLAPVPEPGSLALLVGMASIGGLVVRRNNRK